MGKLQCWLGPVNVSLKSGTRASFDFTDEDERIIQNMLSRIKGQPLKITIELDKEKAKVLENAITEKQSGLIFQLLKDITLQQCGKVKEDLLQIVREERQKEFGRGYFSFNKKECSKQIASDFIEHLIIFILDNDISTNIDISQFIGKCGDNVIEGYLRAMIEKEKCAICGQHAEIHHWDTIGMGGDRRTDNYKDNKIISLCREHHNEAHQSGRDSFETKYHLWGIVHNKG